MSGYDIWTIRLELSLLSLSENTIAGNCDCFKVRPDQNRENGQKFARFFRLRIYVAPGVAACT